MQQQLAGRHVPARCSDAGVRDAAAIHQPWRSPAAALPLNRCHAVSCRRQRSPHRLHVSCPAVEQDTDSEVASTSGRPHTDSELIQTLLGHEQAAVLNALEGQPQPNYQKDLVKRIKTSGSLPLLCELIQAEAHHFDHKVTSAALYRLSILCHAYFTQLQSAHLTSQEAQQAAWVKYVDPALKALGQLLLQHLDSCDSWTVAISLWAYGHVQCSEEAVLASLSIRGMQLLHDFNTTDCASALVGLSKLTGPRTRAQREFVEQLMQHTHELLSHVDEWSPRDIVSVVWALSQLGAAGPSRRPLLQGLVEMTQWRLHEFHVREIVITIYSLGRLRMRLPLQMVKLTNQIMQHMEQLNPQDAANLVYSCAKVQFKQPELLQRLPEVMVGKLSSFKPQEISNLLYGYGQLHYVHPLLLDAVAQACPPRLQEFSTQDLCLTVWSYGAVGYCPADTALFEAACRVLLQRKERLVPLQITMVCKGFAKAGYQPPAAFMQQMSQLAQAKLMQFSPLEYSQLLWAYSTAGYRDVALFEAVVAHCIQQLLSKEQHVNKATVDTVLVACQGVGFWPQMLVDTAEINGLYVKTQMQPEDAGGMQPLSPPAMAAAGAAQAAAAATAAAAEAALAAVGSSPSGSQGAQADAAAGSQGVEAQAGGEAGEGAASAAAAVAAAAAAAAVASRRRDQAAISNAVTSAFDAAAAMDDGSSAESDTLVQQQQQASRLDTYKLQRPQLPQRQRQQDDVAVQQQQQQPQQQGSLDHPLLRAHLLPPPLLPQQQQQQEAVPAAAAAGGGSYVHNGTSSSSSNNNNSSSQHSTEHVSQFSSGSSSSSSEEQQEEEEKQQEAGIGGPC